MKPLKGKTMSFTNLNPPGLKAASIAAVMMAGAAAIPAQAAIYVVNFETLNNSGVTGTATLDHDEEAQTLQVRFDVSGLEPNQGHVAHIHGVFDDSGNPANSVSPTIADDMDGDGFVELGEGVPSYGPIIIPLGDIGANADGTSMFSMLYDLTETATFGEGFSLEDLIPLTLREIVIHGLTVPAGPGAGTTGEVNGTNGYLAVLPVASGQIMAAGAIPEPATWATMLLGFFAMGGLMRRAKSNRKVTFAF